MRRGFEIAVLVLSGAALAFTGVTGLLSPQSLFEPLGLPIEGTSALNEIRAAYGGMHLGVGALLLVGAARGHTRRAALWLALAFLGGLTAGRFVSLFVDGAPNAFVYRLWVPEALGACASAALLFTSERPRRD